MLKNDKKLNKNIALFLMTEKGYRVLEAVAKMSPNVISCVVSAKDNNVANDFYNEIKSFCIQNAITFYDRKDHMEIDSKYSIAISWRWLIDASKTKLIVLHDSLLPKYRGFSPLVTTLINGDSKIGVTAILASEGYDEGEIIGQASTEISYPIKIQDAIQLITDNYVELTGWIINEIIKNTKISGKKQDENAASYSLWRDNDDYIIDWSQSSKAIRRFIDAVGYPYLGALTTIKEKKIRIFDAEEVSDVFIENRTPGKVIFLEAGFPVVVCGEGLLKITNMIDDETKDSLLPFSKFRVRFG